MARRYVIRCAPRTLRPPYVIDLSHTDLTPPLILPMLHALQLTSFIRAFFLRLYFLCCCLKRHGRHVNKRRGLRSLTWSRKRTEATRQPHQKQPLSLLPPQTYTTAPGCHRLPWCLWIKDLAGRKCKVWCQSRRFCSPFPGLNSKHILTCL